MLHCLRYSANKGRICKNDTINHSMNKEKSQRFQRLASNRTNEVLDKLRILGNCADKRSYQYTDEEIDKIFRAIDEQIKIVKSKFKQPRRSFRLK